MDAIHLPPGLTLPSAFGAPAAPLQAGQVIQALVLELIESDIFRLQLPQATVDVRSSVPLTPGSTITLAVKGTGANTRLAIYTDAPPTVRAVARGTAPAPNLTGRTPIGEAVVIARAPAGQGTPIAPQSAASRAGTRHRRRQERRLSLRCCARRQRAHLRRQCARWRRRFALSRPSRR